MHRNLPTYNTTNSCLLAFVLVPQLENPMLYQSSPHKHSVPYPFLKLQKLLVSFSVHLIFSKDKITILNGIVLNSMKKIFESFKNCGNSTIIFDKTSRIMVYFEFSVLGSGVSTIIFVVMLQSFINTLDHIFDYVWRDTDTYCIRQQVEQQSKHWPKQQFKTYSNTLINAWILKNYEV